MVVSTGCCSHRFCMATSATIYRTPCQLQAGTIAGYCLDAGRLGHMVDRPAQLHPHRRKHRHFWTGGIPDLRGVFPSELEVGRGQHGGPVSLWRNFPERPPSIVEQQYAGKYFMGRASLRCHRRRHRRLDDPKKIGADLSRRLQKNSRSLVLLKHLESLAAFAVKMNNDAFLQIHALERSFK